MAKSKIILWCIIWNIKIHRNWVNKLSQNVPLKQFINICNDFFAISKVNCC